MSHDELSAIVAKKFVLLLQFDYLRHHPNGDFNHLANEVAELERIIANHYLEVGRNDVAVIHFISEAGCLTGARNYIEAKSVLEMAKSLWQSAKTHSWINREIKRISEIEASQIIGSATSPSNFANWEGIDFHWFSNTRRDLLTNFSGATERCKAQGLTQTGDKLRLIGRSLESESIRILVLGGIGQGKSTLINALLGDHVIPASDIPSAQVMVQIKFGEESKAIIHLSNSASNSNILPVERTAGNLGGRQKSDFNCIELHLDKVKDYLMGRDYGDSPSRNEITLIQILCPARLCSAGIEFIDCPGFNDSATNRSAMLTAVSSADIVIFALSCHRTVSESAMDFIRSTLRATGRSDVFFVFNQFDKIEMQTERTKFMEIAKRDLGELTSYGVDAIYFVSARDALKGRITRNVDLVEKSGFLNFETSLTRLALQNSGRAKLLRPTCCAIEEIDSALNETIPSLKKGLVEIAKDSFFRLDSLHSEWQKMTAFFNQMSTSVQKELERFSTDVQAECAAFLCQFRDDIPGIVHSFKPKHQVDSYFPSAAQKQATELANEVGVFVRSEFGHRLTVWQREKFYVYVSDKFANVWKHVLDSINEFSKRVERLRTELEFSDNLSRRIDSSGLDIPWTFYVTHDYPNVSVPPDIAGGLAATMGVLINPINLSGLLIGGFLGGLMRRDPAVMTENIKNHVVSDFLKSLEEQDAVFKRGAVTAFYKMSRDFQQQIETDFQNRLEKISLVVDLIFQEKGNVGEQIDQRIISLGKLDEDLRKTKLFFETIKFDLSKVD